MFRTFAAALFTAAVVAKDGKDFKGPEYIALTRQEKSDKIFAKITENSKSGSWHFAGTLVVGQNEVFDTLGDEFDCGFTGCRNKTIHSIGNVGKIQWMDLGGHPYTGIFKGGDSGYARFSAAAPVDTKTPNMKPGMGVKFLRDGMDSANFVAMFSVDGQETLNFFENDWNNHIPDVTTAALIPLELRFKTATEWIQTVGLSEMAQFDQAGAEEASPVFPWKLRFEPTGEWNMPADTYDQTFEQYLVTIPSGSKLFSIYAMDQPVELGGKDQLIGSFVTNSSLVTSYWGDEHMYFRHQRMDDDLKIRPEWEPYTPDAKVFGMIDRFMDDPKGNFKAVAKVGLSACPFAWLLQ